MKIHVHLYWIILGLGIISCAPLTKSQVKLTRNYFETISNYPFYYRELNRNVSSLALNAQGLASSLQDDDSERVMSIVSAINLYERQLQLPDTIEQHLTFIDGYVQGYFILIPDGFNAYKAVKGTTQSIGGLVGLGGVVSALLPEVNLNVSDAKKKKIIKHITGSSEQLQQSLREIKEYVSLYYLPKLDRIDDNSRKDFELLFQEIKDEPDPLAYYTRHNKLLLDFYQKLHLARQMSFLLHESCEIIRDIESEVRRKTREREKITPELVKLNELHRSITRIKLLNAEMARGSGL